MEKKIEELEKINLNNNNELNILKIENKEIMTQNSDLKIENNNYKLELNEQISNYNELNNKYNNLIEENNEINIEKENLENEIMELKKNIEEITETIQNNLPEGMSIYDISDNYNKLVEELNNYKVNNIEEVNFEKIKNLENELSENKKLKENLEIQLALLREENEKLQKENEDFKENNLLTYSTESLNNNNNIFKMKNDELIKQNNELLNKIDNLKDKLSKKIDEEEQREKEIKDIINENKDNNNLEEIKQKFNLLKIQYKDSEEKFNKAKNLIKKIQLYEESINYIKILLKNYKPSNNRELEALNKLKHFIDENNNNKSLDLDEFSLNLDILNSGSIDISNFSMLDSIEKK